LEALGEREVGVRVEKYITITKKQKKNPYRPSRFAGSVSVDYGKRLFEGTLKVLRSERR
jgi:hypothetical protein